MFKKFMGLFYKGKVQLGIVLIVQCLLVFIFCNQVITGKGTYSFYDRADGFKNNYTLSAYVEKTDSENFLNFTGFNYPYGDVITYTDNTPLFSVPLRLFNQWFGSTHGYSTYIFDVFSLLLIVVATGLCWAILRRLTDNPVFIIVFSIALPLLNPQILRFVPGGTLNLSYSAILLGCIYLLQTIYYRINRSEPVTLQLVLLALLIYISAFVHLYYHLILLLLSGSFLFFAGLHLYLQQKPYLKFSAQWLTAVVLSFVAFFITLTLIDYNLSHRNAAMGYNMASWKLQITGLFTAYPFIRNKFLFSYSYYIPYEAHVYLGSFALFSLTALLVSKLFAKHKLISLRGLLQRNTEGVFCGLLLGSAFVMLPIALGPTYHFGINDQYHFFNYFNLFYYLGKATDQVSHFRCLSRFSWPLFWALNFCLIFIASQLIRDGKRWFHLLTLVFMGFSCADMFNTYQFMKEQQVLNPLSNFGNYTELAEAAGKVNSNNYQCILPLPYYHTGTEEGEYTADPETSHFVKSVAFAYNKQLPLMASVMSRTPLYQADDIMSIVLKDKPDSSLLAKLSSKPILVYVDNSYYEDSARYGGFVRPIHNELFFKSRSLVTDYNMKPIASANGISLYELSMARLAQGKVVAP